MDNSGQVAAKLNDLLEKNYDAEKFYRNASDEVTSDHLKKVLHQKALQRYAFGHDLKSEIRSFWETPEKGSSLSGDTHRALMNIKALLSSDKDKAVLEESISAEKRMIEAYNKKIKEDGFPPSTANLLIRHRNNLQETLEEIETLNQVLEE